MLSVRPLLQSSIFSLRPPSLRILIDGYNLAHAAGILATNIGPGTLRRARDGLVGFLAASLTEREKRGATVVFDAKDAPPDLPGDKKVDGIRVLFAFDHPTADDLIEELIFDDSAPRQLVVVSGDRRIQAAARRRGAQVVESEAWHETLRRRRREERRSSRPSPESKPAPPQSPDEVEDWLRFFEEDEG